MTYTLDTTTTARLIVSAARAFAQYDAACRASYAEPVSPVGMIRAAVYALPVDHFERHAIKDRIQARRARIAGW